MEKTEDCFLDGSSTKKKVQRSQGRRLAGARQPAFLRCLRILERTDRADVTETRGAATGRYKGGLWALGQTAAKATPPGNTRVLRYSSARTSGEGRPQTARRPGPRLAASRPTTPTAPARPLRSGVLASLRAGRGPLLRATMAPAPPGLLALAVTLLHLARLSEFLGHRFPRPFFPFPRTTRGRKLDSKVRGGVSG